MPPIIDVIDSQGVLLSSTEAKKQEFFAFVRQAERKKALGNLFYFLEFIVSHQHRREGKNKLDWHHEKLCDDLQRHWESRESVENHIGYKIEWPRDTFKTTVAAIAFPAWVMCREHNVRILLESESATNAYKLQGSIKRLFEGDYFKYLFGMLYKPNESWNSEILTLTRSMNYKEPTVDVGGIEATKTGQHYDLYIGDDLQTDKNATTREQIEKVKDHARQVFNLLTANPKGMAVFLGTRWHFDDLFNWMDEQNLDAKEHLRSVPFHVSHFSSFKGKEFESELEFPSILTIETLRHKRAILGEFQFSCQMMLNPVSETAAAFKAHWIREHHESLAGLRAIGCNVYVTVDPAGPGLYDKADFWAIIVAAITKAYDIYILEYTHDHLTVESCYQRLKYYNEMYSPKKIGMEAVFKQKTMFMELKSKAALEGVRLNIEEFKTSNINKDARIMGLQPFVEQGKFFIRPEFKELRDEMVRYPKAPHKDLLDATAYLVELMNVPASQQPKEFWQNRGWMKDLEENKVALPSQFKKPPTEMDIRAWKFAEQQQRQKARAGNKVRRQVYAASLSNR